MLPTLKKKEREKFQWRRKKRLAVRCPATASPAHRHSRITWILVTSPSPSAADQWQRGTGALVQFRRWNLRYSSKRYKVFRVSSNEPEATLGDVFLLRVPPFKSRYELRDWILWIKFRGRERWFPRTVVSFEDLGSAVLSLLSEHTCHLKEPRAAFILLSSLWAGLSRWVARADDQVRVCDVNHHL